MNEATPSCLLWSMDTTSLALISLLASVTSLPYGASALPSLYNSLQHTV